MKYAYVHIRALALLLCMALGGCALSPQTVDLYPEAKVSAQPADTHTPIQLQALDARPSVIVGSRGGVYAETSLISTAIDLPQRLRAAAAAALSLKGYDAISAQAPLQLRLYLDELSYQVPPGELVTQIDLNAGVRIVAERVDGQRFTGRYRASEQLKVAKAPGTERNQELLNAIISAALTRAFDDPRLYQFLE